MRKLRLCCMVLLLGWVANAQEVQGQTVRGTIISSNGEQVIGATIIVKGTEPLIGTTSDDEGKFRLEVPLGRQSLEVRSVGYSPRVEEVLVSSGHETVVEIRLEPMSYTLEGVEIVRHYNKARPLQPLTYAGARSFSVEGTERYAGSLQDPSRMVRSFAGVMPINDSRNEIVVRGNSPLGVQYRLDGIEVPNPNHFNAGLGMTAGQVTVLNMNIVSNSDFLMGGWPATQGNALAGIFDLNLRNGNEAQHEVRFQMGYNGIEAMVEGPATKDGKLTYIASYRYSIPELISKISRKSSEATPVVPKYQDFTAKLRYEFNDRHALSLVGLVGNSSIYIQASELLASQSVIDAIIPEDYDQKVDLKSVIAMTGLVYEGQLNDRTQLKSTLSWNYNKVDMVVDTLNSNLNNTWQTVFHDQSQEHKLSHG